jgi:hypothetical protein
MGLSAMRPDATPSAQVRWPKGCALLVSAQDAAELVYPDSIGKRKMAC